MADDPNAEMLKDFMILRDRGFTDKQIGEIHKVSSQYVAKKIYNFRVSLAKAGISSTTYRVGV